MNESDQNVSRREFLSRSAKALAAAAAAGLIGRSCHDATGPAAPGARTAQPAGLADFSVPESRSRMAVARGRDRARSVRACVAAMGGMDRFVTRGDRVLLKVNAAFASPPSIGATSHPQLVAELARLCFAAGAAKVIVTDNPMNDPAACFELTGIGPAARGAGAEVALPRADYFRPFSLPGGRLIADWPVLLGPLESATKLIGVAPVKDHHRAGASLALKNWYGLLGGRRSLFHQEIHAIIAELARLVRPTLVVLDGVTAMIRNGPTGGSLSDLAPTDTMIVSTDPVAADAFGATLLGLTVNDLPWLASAAVAGAGTANYELLSPIRLDAG